jgi:hypothetical protein
MNPDLRTATRDATRALLDGDLVVYACWWVGLVAVSLAVDLIIRARIGVAASSAWDWAASTPKALMLALGAVLCTVDLPRWVSHGITRRAFSLAAGIVTAGATLAGAIFIAAGYAAEAVVTNAAGWPLAPSATHLFTRTDQWHLIILESTLLFAAWAVSGWLAGAGWYRWGWRGGMPFMLLAAIPLVAAEALARALDRLTTAGHGVRRLPVPPAGSRAVRPRAGR